MNARGWLEDGVDLALVGAVAAWIGIAGAFLASLTPTAEVRARLHSSAPSRECSDVRKQPVQKTGRIPEGAFSCGAEDGAAQNLPAGFLDRLAMVESGGDDAATNAAEGAHGRWQVRAGYLADGNAEAGTSYALAEMHDPQKAETIVRAYLSRYGRAFAARAGRAPTAEELARIHNGGPRGAESPRTLAYARAFAATEGGRP